MKLNVRIQNFDAGASGCDSGGRARFMRMEPGRLRKRQIDPHQQSRAAEPRSRIERNSQSKIAAPVETTLPNGIHLMILEDHRFPLVTVLFDISGAGPIYEPATSPAWPAQQRACCRMERKRARANKLPNKLIRWAHRFPRRRDSAPAQPCCPHRDCRTRSTIGSALAADVLLHPSFPADELAQYQARAKSALLQQRSQPEFLANQTMSRALYGTYPAAVVSATPESLDSLTPAMLAEWHDKHYAPQNTILAISGDVHAADADSKAARMAGGVAAIEFVRDFSSRLRPPAKRKKYF